MIVICKKNKLKSFSGLKLKFLEKYYKYDLSHELNIKIGKIYNVYGIIFWENVPFYYIYKEDMDYPTPICGMFFDFKDNNFSKYWALRTIVNPKGFETIVAFREWAEDKMFYENLLNEELEEVKLMKKYRKLIDEE